MADVFLSYKRKDIDRARPLRSPGGLRVDAVLGLSGEVWNAVLDRELEKASCVVVLWSHRSVEPGVGASGGQKRRRSQGELAGAGGWSRAADSVSASPGDEPGWLERRSQRTRYRVVDQSDYRAYWQGIVTCRLESRHRRSPALGQAWADGEHGAISPTWDASRPCSTGSSLR
jgi:hypothetical protein